jgi:hypothetical protein
MSSRRSTRPSTAKSSAITAARQELTASLYKTRRDHRIYIQNQRYMPVKVRFTTEDEELQHSSAKTLDALLKLKALEQGDEATANWLSNLINGVDRKTYPNFCYEIIHRWMEQEAPTLRGSNGKFIHGTRSPSML